MNRLYTVVASIEGKGGAPAWPRETFDRHKLDAVSYLQLFGADLFRLQIANCHLPDRTCSASIWRSMRLPPSAHRLWEQSSNRSRNRMNS